MNDFKSHHFNKLFDLKGRVALVTGAAGWLGAPISWALASSGATVVVVGRTEPSLRQLAEMAAQQGLKMEAEACDIQDAEACQQLMQGVLQRHSKLHIVVNNASSAIAGGKGLDAPDSAFAEAANLHCGAAWRLINLALPGLRAAVSSSGDASVINIGSMYGKVSPVPKVYEATGQPPNPVYYGAAKAGLLQMTRWLACRLGPERIRVNSISPGAFPQWDARERTPDFVSALDQRSPLGRIGSREEMAGPVLFLASKASIYVNGADIAVDGGWTAW